MVPKKGKGKVVAFFNQYILSEKSDACISFIKFNMKRAKSGKLLVQSRL